MTRLLSAVAKANDDFACCSFYLMLDLFLTCCWYGRDEMTFASFEFFGMNTFSTLLYDMVVG